ncbi:hypothetical protein BXZ70DRAFT_154968 [Cristinia sonorae]|uniref:BTB domain-containing protein n=1 Tax=Cristinia sonorae TaxID=1940300 RepID=A0A8K0UPB9_9AGAR|nr:hypothetical protein BXZ70DRAFT_154968 [Cristinia sonorae]
MGWSEFTSCEDGDFIVRSIPDGHVFTVKRERLEQGSTVFRDMFSCCDSGYVVDMLDEESGTLDLDESAERLSMLFQLLHNLPDPYHEEPVPKSQRDFTRVQSTLPKEPAIPFPILPILLSLADKYALSETIVHCVHSHLAAHTSTYPLRVYGYATSLGLHDVAARASTFLLSPPLSSHPTNKITALPNAQAYHKLVQLHDYRIRKLKEVLMGEQIFPHGYGKCPRHAAKTDGIWEERKKNVIAKILAATDVAAEMAEVQSEVAECEVCTKATTAAISMLAYKCAKIPKRIDKIPVTV